MQATNNGECFTLYFSSWDRRFEVSCISLIDPAPLEVSESDHSFVLSYLSYKEHLHQIHGWVDVAAPKSQTHARNYFCETTTGFATEFVLSKIDHCEASTGFSVMRSSRN